MRGLWTALLCTFALFFTSAAEATVISVSPGGNGDYRVMQEALDASAPGDTILVKAGFHRDYTELWHGGALRKAVGFVPHQLTIIGESEFAWVEGPSEVGGVGFYSMTTDSLAFLNVQFRGSDAGLAQAFGDYGKALVRDCRFEDGRIGAAIAGIGSILRLTRSTMVRIGDAGVLSTVYAHASVDSTTFHGTHVNGQGISFLATNRGSGHMADCESSEMKMAQVNTEGSLTVDRCEARAFTGAGLLVRDQLSQLSVSDCLLIGNLDSAVGISIGNNATFIGRGLSIKKMWQSVVIRDARDISLQNSDIHPGTNRSIFLEAMVSPPDAFLDFTNNWWGTTDTFVISESIWDGNDDPQGTPFGFVSFEPIASEPLPTESTTMGFLKKTFQDRR